MESSRAFEIMQLCRKGFLKILRKSRVRSDLIDEVYADITLDCVEMCLRNYDEACGVPFNNYMWRNYRWMIVKWFAAYSVQNKRYPLIIDKSSEYGLSEYLTDDYFDNCAPFRFDVRSVEAVSSDDRIDEPFIHAEITSALETHETVTKIFELAKLTEFEKTIVVWRTSYDMPFDDIAEQLQYPTTTVRKYFESGLAKLQAVRNDV